MLYLIRWRICCLDHCRCCLSASLPNISSKFNDSGQPGADACSDALEKFLICLPPQSFIFFSPSSFSRCFFSNLLLNCVARLLCSPLYRQLSVFQRLPRLCLVLFRRKVHSLVAGISFPNLPGLYNFILFLRTPKFRFLRIDLFEHFF